MPNTIRDRLRHHWGNVYVPIKNALEQENSDKVQTLKKEAIERLKGVLKETDLEETQDVTREGFQEFLECLKQTELSDIDALEVVHDSYNSLVGDYEKKLTLLRDQIFDRKD